MANPRRSWSMFKVVVVVLGMLSMTAVSAGTDPDPETNDGVQDKFWMVEHKKNYDQNTLASGPSPSAESEEAEVAGNGNYEHNTLAAAPSPSPDSEQEPNVAVVKHENHEPLTPASPPHLGMHLFRSHHGRFLPHFVLPTLKPWHNAPAPAPGPGPADSMQEDSKQDTLPSKSVFMQGLNAAIPEGDKLASAQPHDDKHKHNGHDTKPSPPKADFEDDSSENIGADHKNKQDGHDTKPSPPKADFEDDSSENIGADHKNKHDGHDTKRSPPKADFEDDSSEIGADHIKSQEHKTLAPPPSPRPTGGPPHDQHEQHGDDTAATSQKTDFEDDSSEDGADHKSPEHKTLAPPPSPRPTWGPPHDQHEQHRDDTAATSQKSDFEDDSSEDADHKTNEHQQQQPSNQKANQDSKPAAVDHLHEHGTTAALNHLAPTPAPGAHKKSKKKLFGKSQKNVAIAGNEEHVDTPVPAPSYDDKGYNEQDTPGPSPNVDFEEHKEETSNGIVVGHENNEHVDTLTPPPPHEHHVHHISATPRHPIARRYGYFFPGS
ncbi:unnamed protein product [Calypogeia fissa]